MNFFKGLEYEPTFDCEAMLANTGREKDQSKKIGGEAEKRREDDAFGPSINKDISIDGFLFQETRHNFSFGPERR